GQPAAATLAATPSAPATLSAMPPVAATVRVQVGAFADPANARAAAQTLGRFGAVSLEPVTRGDQTLWRVVVAAPPGEDGPTLAGALAGAGFPGARLLP
ncbi:MAG: SPOR domain-containing protein, partial [Alphaproteobacteria bacterium]|nr:SPOR domain-containing protein [Alphaproteobacteria bacterium]